MNLAARGAEIGRLAEALPSRLRWPVGEPRGIRVRASALAPPGLATKILALSQGNRTLELSVLVAAVAAALSRFGADGTPLCLGLAGAPGSPEATGVLILRPDPARPLRALLLEARDELLRHQRHAGWHGGHLARELAALGLRADEGIGVALSLRGHLAPLPEGLARLHLDFDRDGARLALVMDSDPGCLGPAGARAFAEVVWSMAASLVQAGASSTPASVALAEPPAPRPLPACPPLLLDQIEEVAAHNPEGFALVHGAATLRWGALVEAARRQAARLVADGLGRGARVAVVAGGDPAAIVGLVAVWMAGAAWSWVDDDLPAPRASLMLDALRPDLILPVGARAAALVAACEAPRPARGQRGACPAARPTATDLAVVVLTSGSTGRPRPVEVEHAQIARYVGAVVEALDIKPGWSHASPASPMADLGYTAFFAALATGGTLHLLDESTRTQPASFQRWMSAARVDCLKIVPSHLDALLPATLRPDLLPARRLVLGGEGVRCERLAALAAIAPECALFAHYGPTETTVGVCTWRYDGRARGPAPIGRPLASARLTLVDPRGEPVPLGVPGEILVGGATVTRGYGGLPADTAARFRPDPWSAEPGARVYATGDLGVGDDDGAVVFLGRIDRQLKLDGVRVEPEGVEALLSTFPGVRAAAVAPRTQGSTRLVAWLTWEGQAAEPAELRAWASARLPAAAVPSRFVAMDALPMLPNGKVDRARLALPPDPRPEDQELTPLQADLARLWVGLLGGGSPGPDDDFFARGGSSLMAMHLVEAIRENLGVELPMRAVFDHPTLADLSQAVARAIVDLNPDEFERALAMVEGLDEDGVQALLASGPPSEGVEATPGPVLR